MGKNLEVIFDKFFGYKKGEFYVENVPVRKLAIKYGTPAYIYSYSKILSQLQILKESFAPVAPLICYSVKANSNLSILKMLEENGLGADVVSEGELRRALLTKFRPSTIVFAGVGKKEEEIEFGIKKNIFCFNVENKEELDIIEKFGRKYRKKVTCNLRLNLDVDVDTHHYMKTSKEETKFGIDLELAKKIIKKRENYEWAKIKGFHLHLGSQIKEPSPYLKALEKVKVFSRETGFIPEIIDIGGGFGIPYSPDDKVCPVSQFGKEICNFFENFKVKTVILEPGRFIIGNSSILISKVIYFKERKNKKFLIVDAGMNDLIRPAFYGSYHTILPAIKKRGKKVKADVVGPICETGDFLGKDVEFPCRLKKDDYIVIGSTGAYSFSMSSNYNTRPRPCEVLVGKSKDCLIRKRESFKDLWKDEL